MSQVVQTGKRSIPPVLSGLLFAFTLSLALTLILSLLLWLTNMRESGLTTSAYVIHAIALIAGGFVAGRKGTAKGWYHGGMLGIIYATSIFLIGFLAFDAEIGLGSFVMWLAAIAIGTVGGMLGVNTSN